VSYEYRGTGFNTADVHIQLVLFMLAEEIDRMPNPPDWLRETRAYWHREATNGVRGMVLPELDQRLGSDPDRVAAGLALAGQVRRRLEEYAPAIPQAVVNSLGTGFYSPTGERSGFGADLSTDVLISDVDDLMAILRGDVLVGNYVYASREVRIERYYAARRARTRRWFHLRRPR
jgi:hypothetical protein